MGLRGPGARPKSRRETTATGGETNKPWEKRGLSRPERVIKFCETLTVTSGAHAGRRLKLRAWQKRLIRDIYATDKRRRRQVRQAVISMGRKNGKSSLAAALALCHLVGPEAVQRGQVVSAAADRGQASLIYAEVMAYADAVPWITERLTPRQHNKTITDEETGSTFSALSSDHRKAHGLSPTLAICDEVAQWRGRDLLDALRTGMGAHDEPLLIAISTRSPDPENPLEELLRYGEEADDPTFRAYSWSAPLDADPWAEETWAAANPGLGDFRSKADVQQQAQQARALPSLEPSFRAYVLNQPVASEERFIGPRDWDGCAGTAEPRGPCYAGLDLSSGANDLTSVALYWPETGLLRVWGFIPAEVLDDKAHEDRADYRVWRNRGLVVETPGRAMDKAWLGHWIAEQTEALDLRVIASDRWGLNDLKVAWEREGVELPLEPVGTGFRDMSPAVRSFEAAVLDRRIQHEGNPLLRWAVANVAIEMDASGNRKPSKAKARGRIDPAIAAIQAVAAAGRAPAVQEYDFSGDRVLAL